WMKSESEGASGGTEGAKGRFPNLKNKSIWLLIAAAALGLVALLLPSPPSGTLTAPGMETAVSTAGSGTDAIRLQLAQELEGVLAAVEGAGKVQVSITLASEGERVYARNSQEDVRRTVEYDSNGGERDITEDSRQSEVALASGAALLQEHKPPVISGVLVLADGAADVRMQEQLTDLTATLLGISPHCVRVAARSGSE
ncbi:MAG: hypothetical protein Q4B48_02010, partial [Syntrophomonadaceae bacterium]|nr:hypothetical protein [Syntrophomonadaceae bacterium]